MCLIPKSFIGTCHVKLQGGLKELQKNVERSKSLFSPEKAGMLRKQIMHLPNETFVPDEER